MNFINELLETSPILTTASRYTALNGVIYLIAGVTLAVWPGVVQTLFRDPNFTGHEGALMRVIGLTVLVIGWLYVFRGRSGARQIVAASVVDRLVFLPLVLLPIAMAGVFPHMFIAFALLDASLAVGAWWLMHLRVSAAPSWSFRRKPDSAAQHAPDIKLDTSFRRHDEAWLGYALLHPSPPKERAAASIPRAVGGVLFATQCPTRLARRLATLP